MGNKKNSSSAPGSSPQPEASFSERLEKALRELGVDLGSIVGQCGDDTLRCVVVAPNLRDGLKDLSSKSRDHVVMVRVDEETAAKLDAWVETGAVKSRSEAAALFIREGLRVYAAELERLAGALTELETARKKLREQVNIIFGPEEGKST